MADVHITNRRWIVCSECAHGIAFFDSRRGYYICRCGLWL